MSPFLSSDLEMKKRGEGPPEDGRTRVTPVTRARPLNVECFLSVLFSLSVTDGWNDRLVSAPGGKGGGTHTHTESTHTRTHTLV